MATSQAATYRAKGTAPKSASRCPWKIAPPRHLRGDVDQPMPQIANVDLLDGWIKGHMESSPLAKCLCFFTKNDMWVLCDVSASLSLHHSFEPWPHSVANMWALPIPIHPLSQPNGEISLVLSLSLVHQLHLHRASSNATSTILPPPPPPPPVGPRADRAPSGDTHVEHPPVAWHSGPGSDVACATRPEIQGDSEWVPGPCGGWRGPGPSSTSPRCEQTRQQAALPATERRWRVSELAVVARIQRGAPRSGEWSLGSSGHGLDPASSGDSASMGSASLADGLSTVFLLFVLIY